MKYLLFFLIISINESFGMQDDSSSFNDFRNQRERLDLDSSNYYRNLYNNALAKKGIAAHNYEIALWKYSINNLSHRRRSFEWQLLSSKFIFFIVMFIVVCGIIFSGLQFYQSWKMSSKFTKMANSKNLEQIEKLLDQDESQITVSPSSGVSITTSVVGFLVLCISICFFYLYLQHVYPINEAQIDNLSSINAQLSNEEKNVAGSKGN
jgi:hypothetical protein